uniref:Uncharacterized protein n=1 Tax=Anopheles gambiae TaxID=7165 RepID=A0A1S4HE61_ANOGA
MLLDYVTVYSLPTLSLLEHYVCFVIHLRKKCFTIASLLLLVPAPSAAFQFLCANMLCTIKKWAPSEEGTFLLAHIPNDTLILKLSHLRANTFNLATLDKIMAIEIERSPVKKVVMPSSTATVRLKVSRTYLSDIAFVAGNARLNFLTITESRLKTIPSTIVHLVALETVAITKSPIETVNLWLFSKLTRLYELNLCSNKILFLHLPATSAGDFASLRLLFLADNLLTTINLGAFNGMQALQTLDFQNNRIRRVQGALVSNSLQTLELSGNRLETLYCCEWHLPNLNHLALSLNVLSMLPTCLSLTMPNVLYLILDRNALIDSGTWYNIFTLKRLQQLDISHNRLTKAVLDNISNSLLFLDLQYNNITVLHVPAARMGLRITASYNAIDTFDIKSLSPNVTTLEMFCNPIDCSFNRARMQIGQEPVCYTDRRNCNT